MGRLQLGKQGEDGFVEECIQKILIQAFVLKDGEESPGAAPCILASYHLTQHI